jgi:hypothetical protein
MPPDTSSRYEESGLLLVQLSISVHDGGAAEKVKSKWEIVFGLTVSA